MRRHLAVAVGILAAAVALALLATPGHSAPETSFQRVHHLQEVARDRPFRRAFGIEAFPTNVILDREGTVRYVEAGFNPAAIDKTLQFVTMVRFVVPLP
jgi:hypothetical protein